MLTMLWRIIIWSMLVVLTFPTVQAFYFRAGMRWQYILLYGFVAAYAFTPLCRWLALRLNILDRPGWRKVHDRATPLLGGVAVYCAFLLSLTLNGVFLPGMGTLVAAGTLIFMVGLWDDVRSLSPVFRLGVQLAAALYVVFIGHIQLKILPPSIFGAWVNVPLTVLWLVGLTNAMNFFDGIDGLAAGQSIIISVFFGAIAFKSGQAALGWMAVAITGACAGFMPFNFIPGRSARLFLGDAGSTFLGFTLAGVAVFGEWSSTSHFVSLTAPVLIFGVLIFDMLYVTLSRIKNRKVAKIFEPLATASQDHLHHRLLGMGFARKEAAFAIFTLSVCLGVSALIIMDGVPLDALLGLFQAVLLFTIIVSLMFKGRKRRVGSARRDDDEGSGGGNEYSE